MRLSTMSNRKQFFSTADIAKLLSVDPSTVKRWAESGKLHCYRTMGGHRRFTRQQIEDFIEAYHLEGMVLTGRIATAKKKR